MANDFFVKTPDSWLACVSHCQDLLEEGATLKITVKDARKRSLSQNALLFMWYGELSTQIKQKSGESYSTDDLHEYFKMRFCPSKQLRFGGKEIQVTTTTRLDTGEMTRYLDQIHEWSCGAGFKLTIPINSQYREMIERQNG